MPRGKEAQQSKKRRKTARPARAPRSRANARRKALSPRRPRRSRPAGKKSPPKKSTPKKSTPKKSTARSSRSPKKPAKKKAARRGAPAWDSIAQGDCVKLLGKLADGEVDLAFADPPFNIGFRYDVYQDRQADGEYLDWCRTWIGELHRVLKDDGTFWLAIGDEYAAELKWIATRETGFICRSWVIWYYTFGVNCTRKFNRSHAHLFQFIKNEKQFTFNADDPDVRVPSARALVLWRRSGQPGGTIAGRHLDSASARYARQLRSGRRYVVLSPRGGHL